MSTLDFDLPSTQGHTGNGFGGRESQVFPKFYAHQKQMTSESSDAGVPMVHTVDMVEIFQAGERDTTREVVTSQHQQRWPQQWAAYKAGREAIADGTPLELLFPANPEVVLTMKAMHIHTVQALLGVSDSATHIPFLTEHKKKAKVFLDGVEKGKGFHVLEKKLEESELKRMEQEDLIKTMSARLTALEAKNKE